MPAQSGPKKVEEEVRFQWRTVHVRLLEKEYFQMCRAAAMEPARLRTSNGGLPITSFTVVAHESVIQK